MADIDDVLERIITDPAFRQQLHDDRDKALGGYDLSEDDREMLAAQLSGSTSGHQVEQRTGKSALAGLLGDLIASGGSPQDQREPPTPE